MPFFKSRFDKRNIKKEQKSKYSIKKHTFLPKFKYFCCFSHKSEVKVKKNSENAIVFEFGSLTDTLAVKITICGKEYEINEKISGEKTIETREVRPTNTKYISYRDNNTGKVYKKDSDVPESAWDSEKGVDTVINHYDAIQFWVGYETNRPGALVEVKGAELIDVCDEETKEPIVYEHNGNEYTMTEIDYHLGKVIEKMNC